jgi:hypothetical protein
LESLVLFFLIPRQVPDTLANKMMSLALRYPSYRCILANE